MRISTPGCGEKRLQVDYAYQAVRKDGSLVWVETRVKIVAWEGAPAIQTIICDITERKQAEEALRASEEKYRTLFADSIDPIFITSQDGTFLDVNQAHLDLFGYARDEILKVNALHLYADAAERDRFQRAIAPTGTVRDYAVQNRTKDGTVLDCLLTATVRRADDGSILGYQGIVQNITAHKQAKEALRASRDQYRLVTDNLPVIITYVDPNLNFQFANQTFEDWFGISPVGQTVETSLGEKAFHIAKPYMERALSGENVTYKSVMPYQSGGTRHVSVHYIPHVEDAGKVLGFFALIEDITERTHLEEQLRQAHKMEAIGTLAGGIAHDFNNILAILMTSLFLIEEEVAHERKARGYLQDAHTAVHRATDLVQQILTFSRHGNEERTPLQLAHTVKDALTLLGASLPTTITIQAHLSQEGCTILAAATQIYQLMLNLCTNAEHAMRDTGGILEVRLDTTQVDDAFVATHPDLEPGLHAHLTVRDTGHGMAPNVLERMFDPFYTTKGVGEGTGMGLAMVHGIVTNHGGAITVESTPGAGTTFAIYLPLYIPRMETTTAQPIHAEAAIPHGRGCILFVDDEVMLVRLGQEMLEHLGYEVVSRTSSIEALEAFRAMPQRFDVVITDHTMPNMTGEQLARELRRIRPDIPIILCTGFSHTMNSDRAQAVGIDAFCMKPVVARDLAVTIQQVLAQRSKQPPQTSARILLIDDDAPFRATLHQFLESEGYEVSDASDGHQGIQRYKDTPTDVVITDLLMPEKEGLETIQELRRDFPGVKIIAISGGAKAGTMDFLPVAQQLGAQRVLPKPFEPDALLGAIQEVLQT